MKNKKKTTACLLLAVLLITAGITYNPISAYAGAYKKSVSKKITIDPNKYNYMILEVKEEAEITITVETSNGRPRRLLGRRKQGKEKSRAEKSQAYRRLRPCSRLCRFR